MHFFPKSLLFARRRLWVETAYNCFLVLIRQCEMARLIQIPVIGKS